MATRVLVVEDDASMLMGLKDNLEYENYEVTTATNGVDGLKFAQENSFDLIILDVMLPQMDGFEVCRQIRTMDEDVPIIMLTAKNQEIDKVVGLKLGADDYITKPFSIRELLARLEAVLRRQRRGTHPSTPKIQSYEFGDVKVDFRKCMAYKGKQTIELTHYEVEILKVLIGNKEEPISRNRMLDEIWGFELFPTTRTIDNHIVKLRQKLEDDPKDPKHIITVHGIGYKFLD
ncbi:MAG: response regulator transcription factor [Planctomycetota bacterium]|jgi:two-component system alkaline phosphatase synthesis response regulator PhoP|nr:response regulator transcription factor [Planctomycetota bacterium]MDP7128938.1 response regulator transcription factor [Planctomycetota bacterium]MDP7251192.1 response regulator transcription factor [Planctomycetota bacterium]